MKNWPADDTNWTDHPRAIAGANRTAVISALTLRDPFALWPSSALPHEQGLRSVAAEEEEG